MPVETLRVEAHNRSYVMQWPVENEGDQAPGVIARCLRDGRPYERSLLEHIYEQGFAGTAVDVGANIGNHSIWMAAVCGLDVVAFEPIAFRRLRTNVRLNELEDRIRIEEVALGETAGGATRVGRGRLGVGESSDENSIPVRTLDSFDLSQVSLIKIDVEGMEPAALAGGSRTIQRDRPVIFAEEQDTDAHRSTGAVLEPWGYSAGAVFRGSPNATPVRRWNPDSETGI